MKKKNIVEIFQDIMSHGGKRFVFGIVTFAIGIVLCITAVLAIVGAPIMLFGLCTMFACFAVSKGYYVGTYAEGEGENCNSVSIVKLKDHVFPPIICFLHVFFYLPYRVRYVAVKNTVAPNIEPGSRISICFMNFKAVDYTFITKEQAKGLADGSVSVSSIAPDCGAGYEEYKRDVARFVEAGLLTEEYNSRQFSLCRLRGEACAIFAYCEAEGHQCGVICSGKTVDEISENPAGWMNAVFRLTDEAWRKNMIILNDATFNKMKKLAEQGEAETLDDIGDKPEAEAEKAAEKVLKDYKNTVNALRDTAPITVNTVVNALNVTYVGSRKVNMVWQGIVGAFGFGLGVASIFFAPVMAIIFIPLCGYLCWCAYKNFKQIKPARELIGNRRFTLVKSVCTELEPLTDNEDSQYGWRAKYENGAEFDFAGMSNRETTAVGEAAYLLYFEGEERKNWPCRAYTEVLYSPAEELLPYVRD